MITREVNEWIRKVEQGRYSQEDAMEEFIRISKFLTKEEVRQVLDRIKKARATRFF